MRKVRIRRGGKRYEYSVFYLHVSDQMADQIDQLKEIRGGTYAEIGREAMLAYLTRPDIKALLEK